MSNYRDITISQKFIVEPDMPPLPAGVLDGFAKTLEEVMRQQIELMVYGGEKPTPAGTLVATPGVWPGYRVDPPPRQDGCICPRCAIWHSPHCPRWCT